MKEEDRALYAPCPTCKQYSHSIGADAVSAAFNHFQTMIAHPLRGTPMGHAFDETTRDAAQVLMSLATPTPVIETEGSGEDDVEPWQQEAARQLGLLYNYHHDDRHQFTRWQMMTAIAHGSKLAGGSLDLRPVGAENVRENKALGGADAQPALVNEAPTGLHPTGFDQAQGDGE